MSRFEEATDQPYAIIKTLIETKFPNLAGSQIHVIFDTKKRTIGGRLAFGRFQATNDLQKYLSSDNVVPDGYDYIMYLDKNVWDAIDDIDKKRIIFHELNHAEVDLDKKNPYGIKDHEINQFYSEIDFNEDDPKWLMRVSTIGESVYDKDK